MQVAIASNVTGDIVNTATVTSPTDDPNPANNTDDDSSTAVGEADLRILKRHDGARRRSGPDVHPRGAQPRPVRHAGDHHSQRRPARRAVVRLCRRDRLGLRPLADVVTWTRPRPWRPIPTRHRSPSLAHIAAGAGPATLQNTATVQGPLTDPVPGNNSAAPTVRSTTSTAPTGTALTKTVTTPAPPAPVAGEQIDYLRTSRTRARPSPTR